MSEFYNGKTFYLFKKLKLSKYKNYLKGSLFWFFLFFTAITTRGKSPENHNCLGDREFCRRKPGFRGREWELDKVQDWREIKMEPMWNWVTSRLPVVDLLTTIIFQEFGLP